jgi:hypothetical protein
MYDRLTVLLHCRLLVLLVGVIFAVLVLLLNSLAGRPQEKIANRTSELLEPSKGIVFG